ncbi:MAG TPA: LD-carboxypeptidase [Gemmatimonadaceae bacterium]|nr:LD-carboxypeptidase [Gemmatimonadaceae bacterium]
MRLPPLLSAGARVALVAPAGPLRGPEELDNSVANARSLGWEPIPGANVLARHDYLGGTDAERLQDLNAALADDRIDAVWCVRGGYGAMRLLPHVDWASLTRRPRALIGFSDVTALHAAASTRCGLVTYHGPTARGALTDFSRDSLTRAVTEGRDPCGPAEAARTVRGGRAHGRLVGGNLALLAALAGTSYAPDYRGALLVLEDIGEPAYRIDRMLTQLRLSGVLSQIAGLVVGHFTEPAPGHELSPHSLDVLVEEAADIAGVPAITGVPVGHIDDQWTIPLGATAYLDADARSLTVQLP